MNVETALPLVRRRHPHRWSRWDDVAIGRKALEKRGVTREQLVECVLARAGERAAENVFPKPRSLAALFIARGLMAPPHVERIAAVSSDRMLGRLLVDRRQATRVQVAECHRAQRKAGKTGHLGEFLVEKGYLTAREIRQAMAFLDHKTEFHCPSCGLGFTVNDAGSGTGMPCVRCGEMQEPLQIRAAELSPEDSAVEIYLKQKMSFGVTALREAQRLQHELQDFGMKMDMVEVLKRCGFLSVKQEREVAEASLPQVVQSPAWSGLVVPGYQITGKIDQGGQAVVFSAKAYFSGERVALKILLRDLSANALALARFRQEARLMAQFSHSNIVRARESGEHRGVHYIVMDCVEGARLDVTVAERKGFSPRATILLARQVCESLRYMENLGYIHRDVKPENILIDKSDRVRLCDFGFACQIRWRSGGGMSGTTLGTPVYVSPEQGRGERHLTVGTDIYSLGLVLFFALSGHAPFAGESTEEIMARRFSGGAAMPDVDALPAPRPLVEVIRRMLHPSPSMRFVSHAGLLDALARLEA